MGEWLELLASQDDAAWKDNLIGMGSAPHVPKLFHHNGKVRRLRGTETVRLNPLTGPKPMALGWSVTYKPLGCLRDPTSLYQQDLYAHGRSYAKTGPKTASFIASYQQG